MFNQDQTAIFMQSPEARQAAFTRGLAQLMELTGFGLRAVTLTSIQDNEVIVKAGMVVESLPGWQPPEAKAERVNNAARD